ncbi:hypothetical protein [Haloarcula sp. JP-L23]|uniref:hypothetical protein n=1 Tax=Haloarcula sp. JP-L23 TaxID=2716717 RepID=UPI00140F4249|nr:hypothetical protein G9465_21235 [Haloarcula sp. JP-L23]
MSNDSASSRHSFASVPSRRSTGPVGSSRTPFSRAGHGFVATLLAVAPVLLVLGVASSLGFELSGGQCRAATADGDRCSRNRPPNQDCCWQHRELHDVTLHPEGVAEKSRAVEDDLVVR